MATKERTLLESLEREITSNIGIIKKLVDEVESLEKSITTLEEPQKTAVTAHLDNMVGIIEKLTDQTEKMFKTFKSLVE